MQINYVYDVLYKKLRIQKKHYVLTTTLISKYFEVPIEYYVLIDFKFFEKFVDAIL